MSRRPLRPLPLAMRLRGLVFALSAALEQRRTRMLVRTIAAVVDPANRPLPRAVRDAVLDRAVASGDRAAAEQVLADLAGEVRAARAGRPQALRRAGAIEVAAGRLPERDRMVELAVAAYLKGEFSAPPALPTDTNEILGQAASAADALRRAGQADPVIVVNFPGFRHNPYAALLEQAFPAAGLAAVHVPRASDVDALIAYRDRGAYRVVVHANAPNQLVGRARSEAEAAQATTAALRRIDGWLESGAKLVCTIHNGPRLSGRRGAIEQVVAQRILDRADLVHVLTASTPDVLASWARVPAAKVVHVPHPSYDGAYPTPPERDAARRRLGFDLAPGTGREIVVGLMGNLADRKGGPLLLDALDLVPEPLADGRRLRLVVGGVLSGAGSEPLLRRALGNPRVSARFGFIPDAELVAIVAALDVAVLSYQQLNSAWLHLALTHSIPAIAPADGTATEIVRPDALRTFVDGNARSLADALADAGSLATPDARQAARASVAGLDARDLSRRLASAIRKAVDDAPAAAGDDPVTTMRR